MEDNIRAARRFKKKKNKGKKEKGNRVKGAQQYRKEGRSESESATVNADVRRWQMRAVFSSPLPGAQHPLTMDELSPSGL